MWDQRRRPKRTNLHMARNEIVKRRRAAAIRHLGKLDAGNVREPLDHDVLLATGSSPERVVQPRLLLRKGYQLSNRIHAKGRMHREHNWLARQLDDRSEVLQRIDIRLEGMGRARDVIGGDKQRIAVRRTLGRSLDTDVASSTRPVLYKELAAEDPRQIFADDAGSCVGRAAGGKGYNHAHRPRWIRLCSR